MSSKISICGVAARVGTKADSARPLSRAMATSSAVGNEWVGERVVMAASWALQTACIMGGSTNEINE